MNWRDPRSRVRRITSTILFALVLVALGLYATGAFRAKRTNPPSSAQLPEISAPKNTAVAVRARVPIEEAAVGTVRSRRTVEIAAQVTARVVRILAEPGQTIEQGDALLELDGR